MIPSADLSHLPPLARELAECLGIDATLALVRALGGTRVYVPASPGEDLVELLGAYAATALCEQFTGESLDIPRCDKALRAARNASVLAALAAGESLNTVARAHRLTRRQVINIRLAARQAGPAPMTLDLFE